MYRLVASGAVPAVLHVSVVPVLLAICLICPAAVPLKIKTQYPAHLFVGHEATSTP
jgi:hypothetical protein